MRRPTAQLSDRDPRSEADFEDAVGMSIFFMCSMASIALPDVAASGSLSISGNRVGTTCQETP
jgi:hypothetical protein